MPCGPCSRESVGHEQDISGFAEAYTFNAHSAGFYTHAVAPGSTINVPCSQAQQHRSKVQ